LGQYIAATPEVEAAEPAADDEPADTENAEGEEPEAEEGPEADKRFPPAPKGPIKVAILGRPNVGKSTLINALLQADVMLTGPVAGLTREAISHIFRYGDQEFMLIDTPGLRRKGKVEKESLEFLSVGQSLQAAEAADVIILVLDASTHNVSTGNWEIFEQQDAQIAAMAMHQFKPLVVALNKWDAVTDKPACLADITTQLHHRMHAMHTPLALPISSLQSKGLPQLMQAVCKLFDTSYATFSTGKLNNLLAKTLAKRSPPLANGKAVSLKFIRQSDVNPPTFTFWGNRIDQVSGHYKQFLRNQLAEALGLQNLAVKILFKANANPFGHKAKPMKSALKPRPKRS
jgi:GTP-binding protein